MLSNINAAQDQANKICKTFNMFYNSAKFKRENRCRCLHFFVSCVYTT